MYRNLLLPLYLVSSFICISTFSVKGYSMDLVQAKSPIGKYVTNTNVTKSKLEIEELNNEVIKYLHDESLTIISAQYYDFSGDVPWVAIAKNVQNQMLEKSIMKAKYEWNNPGYDLVDVYPQKDSAFAVAMYSKHVKNKTKLVGYYVLKKINNKK